MSDEDERQRALLALTHDIESDPDSAGLDFRFDVLSLMTTERARYVRHLRVDEKCTWRSVAARFEDEWTAGVDSGNQLWGSALCEIAALWLGEDPYEEPWN